LLTLATCKNWINEHASSSTFVFVRISLFVLFFKYRFAQEFLDVTKKFCTRMWLFKVTKFHQLVCLVVSVGLDDGQEFAKSLTIINAGHIKFFCPLKYCAMGV
jgi:hypothetical protein